MQDLSDKEKIRNLTSNIKSKDSKCNKSEENLQANQSELGDPSIKGDSESEKGTTRDVQEVPVTIAESIIDTTAGDKVDSKKLDDPTSNTITSTGLNPTSKFKFDESKLDLTGMDDFDIESQDEEGEKDGEDNLKINLVNKESENIKSPDKLSSVNPFDSNRLNIFEDIMLKTAKSNFNVRKNFNNKEDFINSLNEEDKYEVISDMIDKIKEIDNQLQSVKSELMKTKSIEEAKKIGLITPLDLTESKLHFAFLFASPLVINSRSSISLPQLDFNSELRNIENNLKELEYEVIFKSEVATKENLSSIICGCPLVLHFSGHGIDNTQKHRKLLGLENNLGQGDALILEDPCGKSDVYFEKDLKTISNYSHNKFEVVVVSACHSENIGKVFLNAGAKHVICILKDEEISDNASILFSKVFYNKLFQGQFSICEAFDIAKHEVKVNINITEGSKFIKLMPEDQITSRKKHKCSKIYKMKEGSILNVTPCPTFNLIPSKVGVLLGREQTLYQVIKLLARNRLIIICGSQGIGKTSVVRQLSNYLIERNTFKDGILYVSLKKCQTIKSVFDVISIQIRNIIEGTQLAEMINQAQDEELKETNNQIDQERREQMEHSILKILKNKELLLVLDHCNEICIKEADSFNELISLLLDYCSKLKLLLITEQFFEAQSIYNPKIIELPPIPKELSVKLLILKCHRGEDIKVQEKDEFCECNLQNYQALDVKYSLTNHPLNDILQGHPQAISIASTLLSKLTLKELYMNFIDFYDVFMTNNPYDGSVNLSQMVNLMYVESNNASAIKILALISLFPLGISKEEANQIWNQSSPSSVHSNSFSDTTHNIDEMLSILTSLSLIQCSSGKDEKVYNILPSLTNYSKDYIFNNPELKDHFYIGMTAVMKEYMTEFYHSEKSQQDIEGLIGVEGNVWACITKNFDFDDTANDDIDIMIKDIQNRSKDGCLLAETTEADKDEEMLAIYYAINMMWLNKTQQALNAVRVILMKPYVSLLGIANLCHIMATLLLLSMNKEHFKSSKTLFEEANKVYKTLGILQGEAFGMLGIAQVIIFDKNIKEFAKDFDVVKSYVSKAKSMKNYEKCTELVSNPENTTTDSLSLLL